MSKKNNNLITSIVLLSLIVVIALSNIWGREISIMLDLKPNIRTSNETQVHFIDVGQGEAIAIRFSNGKTMLVDSGLESHLSKLTNYLDNIVLKGSKTIDYAVLTHPDSDHSGNMDFIIENYNVDKFYRPKIYEKCEQQEPFIDNSYYRDVVKALESRNTEVTFNEDKLEIIDGDIKVKWIISQDIDKVIEKGETNDLSPILIVEDNGVKVMLTGDISEDVEEVVINSNDRELLDVDILNLAHHGSKYSNTYDFLKVTSPKMVVASVGENTYGHPANDVMERLLQYDKEFGTTLYSDFLITKDDGNIIFTLNSPNSIDVEFIDNIDNYVFVDYYVYTLISILVILIIIAIPYSKELYKKIRFIIRNKRHAKLKAKEKMQQIKE